MYLQRTIREKIKVEGTGLHTGKPAALVFCPAPENTGVHFVRRDLPGEPYISPKTQFVQATTMATTLGGEYFSVSTVEHCLSAVAALRIDNLIIELQGPEIPIGDGSARVFFDALTEAGIIEQDQPFICLERSADQCIEFLEATNQNYKIELVEALKEKGESITFYENILPTTKQGFSIG